MSINSREHGRKQDEMKKNYSIELRCTHDAAVITRVYPARSMWDKPITDILEVSCEIDRQNFVPKNGYKSDSPEWHYRLLRYAGDPLANWQGEEQAIRIIGQDAIDDAKQALYKSIKSVKGILARGRKHPAYKHMKQIADSAITCYQDDFNYHDVLRLSELATDTRFMWLVRNSGAWLLTEKGDFARCIISEQIKSNEHRVYLWNGQELVYLLPSEVSRAFDKLPQPA